MDKTKAGPITWSVENVWQLRPDLNEDQALEILNAVFRHHNADFGVCPDTLEMWADSLFPRKEAALGCYEVEITETLQQRLTVKAASADEALRIAQEDYRNSVYILDSENFVGVVFSLAEADIFPDDHGGRNGS